MAKLIKNDHIKPENDDILYHLGFSKPSDNFKDLFGDVQFVCTGGSATRMKKLAEFISKELDQPVHDYTRTDRYSMFKVGSVICVNHGIGTASLSILLSEVLKLLHHAGSTNVTFFRVGTSGGLGCVPGTVVVSSGAVNGMLVNYHVQYVLGEEKRHEAVLDISLAHELCSIKNGDTEFSVETGITMGTDDFYEGQGRLDGAFCDYHSEEKFKFLHRASKLGVKNIEMEATCFAATLHRVNVKAAIVCVTILNRLEGDQVKTPTAVLKEWESRPGKLVTEFIKKKLKEQRMAVN